MEFCFGMIADDLTGANDSGIQLKEKGLETSVYFELPQSLQSLSEAIVIDSDARSLNEKNAYEVTKKAAEFLKQKRYRHIYKKMDSTLRGNIGKELEALEKVFEPDFLVVAPAFPTYGRTTENGTHLLDGKPISSTELAEDPKHPVKQAHLPSLIKEEIGQETGLIKRELLKATKEEWQDFLSDLKNKKVKYLVCDAISTEDLRKIATMINSFSYNVIWSGSAGLAEVLPSVLAIEKPREEKRLISGEREVVMAVCGSLSSITQKQIEYATRQSDSRPIIIDTEQIFLEDWEKEMNEYCKIAIENLQMGKDVVLYLPSTTAVRERVKKRARELGLSPLETGKHISIALGSITKRIVLQVPNLNSLVLTGGDTAKDVAKSLGATGFKLNYELEAGIPLGDLIGSEKPMQVVTKAGAFGNEASIYKAIQELKGGSEYE